MYDPARANADSHRASPVRTYIMNVLGVQKVGFWVDMPNRFMAASSSIANKPWEEQALNYNPQVAPYVGQKWDLATNDAKPPKALAAQKPQVSGGGMEAPPPQKHQPIMLNTGHGFVDVLTGAKQEPTKISTEDFVAGGKVTDKDFVKGGKLEAVTKKPKPKPQQKQGLTQKAVPLTVTNRNYYQGPTYQSQVKSLNTRGY